MEQPHITVETPKDSTILAYGTAPGYGVPRFVLGLFVGLAAAIVFLLIWTGFRRPLPVGATTLTIITTPAAAQRELSTLVRDRLPLSWQRALEPRSRWPVVLGGGLGANGWEWFAVVPRWRDMSGLPRAGAGLAEIVYDHDLLKAQGTIRYTDGLKSWGTSPLDEVRGWFEMEDVSTSSSLVYFWYRNGIVNTSLRFEHDVSAFTPRDADLSFDLSSLTGSLREEVVKSLPIPSFAQLPSLKEAHFVFREEGLPETVQLVHHEPLSREASRQVSAGFGVTAKRVIRLEDGTLATELTSIDTDMKEPIRINAQQQLLLQDREIRYGSSTEPLRALPNACGAFPVVGRISPRALDKLVQSIGLVFEPSALAGWQLGRGKDGAMIVCKE